MRVSYLTSNNISIICLSNIDVTIIQNKMYFTK